MGVMWWMLISKNQLKLIDSFACKWWKSKKTLIALELNIFQKKLKKFMGNKNITTNIYRIYAYDSILCRYFCIKFIDFVLKGKIFLDYSDLFSPKKYDKNHTIMLKHFWYLKKFKQKSCMECKNSRNLKILKNQAFSIKR